MPRIVRAVSVAIRTAGLVGGFALACGMTVSAAPAREPALSWQQAKRLAEVIDRLQSDYVDPLEDRRLVDDALRGVLAGLDPNSAYLSAEDYAALAEYTDSELPGVMPTTPTISPSAPGGSAPLPPATPTLAQRGASVLGGFARPGLAHLRVLQFNFPTAHELQREIARLATIAPLAGVVLDLRGNPGGVFDAGVEVADLFLESGTIVTSDGRIREARFVREATPGDLLGGAPLIVLVDGATASAAEIVAGALQDRRRALVMGSRTFGKGSVQSVIPLRSGGAVKFTTARYRTPSGRSIQGVGIEPDLPLTALAAGGDGADPALEHALDAVAAAARSRGAD